jgi:cytochrome c556
MRIILVAATGCLFLAGAAWAASPAYDPILTGQAGFDQMGALFGDMKAGIAAKTDPKQFLDGAKAIKRWASVIPSLFPEGSDKGHDTKAKPDIWSDPAGFQKAADALADGADKLVAAATANDPAAFADAFKATGAACGGCHRNFRVRTE